MTAVDHLPKINVQLPYGLRVFMLADTGASHNYVAGDFLEFLRRNSTQITECKRGSEVIQTASGKITTASKLVTFPLTIAGQRVMLEAFALDLHKGCNFILLRIRSYDNPLYELTEGSPRKGAAIDMKEPQKHMFNELKVAVQNMGWQFNDKELPPKSALQPVAFFSKRLSKTERNYSARERELLGGIASMTHFHCYIDGAPGRFTWVMDHKGIVYFCTQHKLTPREYCYLDRIKQYDPHIIYRKGEENIVADALSRQPGLANNDEPSNDLKQVLVTRRRSALIGPSGPTTLERLTAEATNSELAIKPGMAEAVTEIIACKSHPTWLSIEQKALSIAETTVSQ
ncbi:hypothetical protein NDA13_004851 [Ustilago tritici]|nr:hypothetical protein NDA13_004851 [Ustilago tritici]